MGFECAATFVPYFICPLPQTADEAVFSSLTFMAFALPVLYAVMGTLWRSFAAAPDDFISKGSDGLELKED